MLSYPSCPAMSLDTHAAAAHACHARQVGLSQHRLMAAFHRDALYLLQMTSDLQYVCSQLADPDAHVAHLVSSLTQLCLRVVHASAARLQVCTCAVLKPAPWQDCMHGWLLQVLLGFKLLPATSYNCSCLIAL